MLTAPALMVALVMLGCGEDAAKDKPKVAVEAAKPVPSDAPKTDAASTATPAAGTLLITPATSKVEFIGSKKVGGSHHGGFKSFNGVVELVSDKPEIKTIVIDIDTTSIFTDDEKLTGHLKTKDFFEVDTYPTARFLTTEIKPGGENGATHTLVGNLMLHGVTKSISIPATVHVDGDSMTLTSEFALDKKPFGIAGGAVIRDDVVIKLDVKAAKKS